MRIYFEQGSVLFCKVLLYSVLAAAAASVFWLLLLSPSNVTIVNNAQADFENETH